MKLDSRKIRSFQHKVLSYYDEHGRDLPWRRTTDPYHIMISEIMSQQTQVDRVKDYYSRWLNKWPTIKDLALAPRAEVLSMWMGLGYNNRAVNLHKAAQKIVEDYNSNVIEAVKNYKEIPGIGPYTSGAVQIFSLNADVVTVDTNIRRILIHEFGLDEAVTDKLLWDFATQCLPLGQSKKWHNALMDYGATHLTARKTGIKPKTRQSKFQGSDRQIRARMLRWFLKENESKKKVSGIDFKKLVAVAGILDPDRVDRIVAKMIDNELLVVKNKKYYLKK